MLSRLFSQSPRLKSVQFSYEKAGLRVADEPIPWNAEAILIEAEVEAVPGITGRRSDFQLCVPGEGFSEAAALESVAEDGSCRVSFRLACLQRAEAVGVCWRSRLLGQVTLPHLGAEEFLQKLRLESSTVLARLGAYQVACQSVVEGQGGGLMVCGLLQSPTSLLPIVAWGVTLELTDPFTGRTQRFPVPLTGPQVAARQALVSALPPHWSGAAGPWVARWTVGNRELARTEFRVISRQAFQQSLYLPHGKDSFPERGPGADWGQPALQRAVMGGPLPRIRVASRERGVAAMGSLEVWARYTDPARRPKFERQEVLITDVPALCLPAEVTVEDFQEVESFELFSGGQFLGSVCWRPTPQASFTSEGGFQAPRDFTWTLAAEAEFSERLNRLIGAASPAG